MRPDSGYSRVVYDPEGQRIGEVGLGNRKDIRNAVEAARGALEGWRKTSGHHKAQILYFLAENLSERAEEFARRIEKQTGQDGTAEVEAALGPSSPPRPGPISTRAWCTTPPSAT